MNLRGNERTAAAWSARVLGRGRVALPVENAEKAAAMAGEPVALETAVEGFPMASAGEASVAGGVGCADAVAFTRGVRGRG